MKKDPFKQQSKEEKPKGKFKRKAEEKAPEGDFQAKLAALKGSSADKDNF